MASATITLSANHGTVGMNSLSTSWRHGPNTMTGMPSQLNGPGPITKCADGSKNMLAEFLALLMSNNTSERVRTTAHLGRPGWLPNAGCPVIGISEEEKNHEVLK
jgi:hypothetical protein